MNRTRKDPQSWSRVVSFASRLSEGHAPLSRKWPTSRRCGIATPSHNVGESCGLSTIQQRDDSFHKLGPTVVVTGIAGSSESARPALPYSALLTRFRPWHVHSGHTVLFGTFPLFH